MSSKEILSIIEQFESTFDTYQQLLKKNNEDVLQNLSTAWKQMKIVQTENEKLVEKIREQNSEITALKTETEGLDKQVEEFKTKKDDLLTKITELNNSLEKTNNDLKTPQFELETLISKLTSVNESITAKETEKTTLDQKKVDNENKESDLKLDYTKKMEELKKRETELKLKNFFTSFVIENSTEEVPEVDILATIMEKNSCNLDELKKQLNVPPVMATRKIQQLAVKGIIKIDESQNKVTMG
jgi:chromosome segregation ATPase